MADFAKVSLGFVYSENSDYSNPRLKPLIAPYESTTATQYESQLRAVGFAAPETVELGGFTTIECLVLKNCDATNYVTATFDSAGNSSVDNILRVGPGKILVLTDVTPGSDLVLQANTAAVDCEIFIFGT
jgi:hypothetical protein